MMENLPFHLADLNRESTFSLRSARSSGDPIIRKMVVSYMKVTGFRLQNHSGLLGRHQRAFLDDPGPLHYTIQRRCPSGP